MGSTPHGGHYFSYVRADKKWYKCSDDKVEEADAKRVVDPNAYLLFYQKTDFAPSLMCLAF